MPTKQISKRLPHLPKTVPVPESPKWMTAMITAYPCLKNQPLMQPITDLSQLDLPQLTDYKKPAKLLEICRFFVCTKLIQIHAP